MASPGSRPDTHRFPRGACDSLLVGMVTELHSMMCRTGGCGRLQEGSGYDRHVLDLLEVLMRNLETGGDEWLV